MLKKLTLSLLLILSSLTLANASLKVRPPPVEHIQTLQQGCSEYKVIRDDHGGYLPSYHHYYYSRPHTCWIVDGYCNSACTLVLGTGRVCATPRARFGFHSAYAFGIMNPAGSRYMLDSYPPGIQQWVLRHHALEQIKPMTMMDIPEIWNYVPRCRTQGT